VLNWSGIGANFSSSFFGFCFLILIPPFLHTDHCVISLITQHVITSSILKSGGLHPQSTTWMVTEWQGCFPCGLYEFPVSQPVQRRIAGLIAELWTRKYLTESGPSLIEVLSQYLPGKTGQNYHYDSWRLGRDSNQELPEYNTATVMYVLMVKGLPHDLTFNVLTFHLPSLKGMVCVHRGSQL
jgi:hypothetical protein